MISTYMSLVSITIYSLGLAFYDKVYLVMFLPLIYVLYLQRKYISRVLKKLLFLNIFILIVVFGVALNKNYELAVLILLRSNAILLFTLLLLAQKDVFSIAFAMNKFRLPTKLVSIFFMTAKFIIIIKDEFENTKKVLLVRNFRTKTDLFTYKIYANIIGILVVKCFERASRLKECMIVRNFQGTIYQSQTERASVVDFVILSLVAISIFHIGGISF